MYMKLRWVLLLSLAVGTLFGQTEKATLRGTITDPTGAVIPNATVAVTEVSTGVEARRVTTDAAGNYEIPDLKPSIYRVEVTQTGFTSYRADNVVVDPGQVRRVDIRLAVGGTADSITVEAGAALIQTETGTISGQIDTSLRWHDAPVVDVYPSPLALLTTTPGIKGIPTNGWRIVMSGINSRDQQTWALDGVANDTNADQNDNPNFFRTVEVASVNAGADAARAASFNMVSKQGANEFHGGVYLKEENSALNARDPFLTKKTPYILHEAEVEQGGRIIKDRTFFFFGWMYQKIPLGAVQQANVPTVEMRNGDFSYTGKTIKDPFNGNTPFPNNAIPTSRFNPVSVATLKAYIPAQNVGGSSTFTNNYSYNHPYNQELYKGNWPFIRIDHKLTEKNSLYVRWMARKTPYIWFGTGPGPAFNNTQYRDHRGTVVSDTHIFTPTVVNSFTFGHTTDFLKQGEKDGNVDPLTGDQVLKTIGLQGTNQQGLQTMAFPTMNITGLTNWTIRNAGGYTDNITTNDGINSFLDTLTWAKGKHVIKVGAEVRHFWRYSGGVSQDVYGNFTFDGTFTGQPFADFLLGVPRTSTRLNALVNRYAHQNQVGFFANDSFKITQSLTIDYGVRWDYYGSPVFNDGLMYNWDPTSGNVIVAKGTLSKISPLYPTSLIKVAEGDVVPSPTLKNFRPRISAAYRLNDKTVIRGGYGEFTATYAYYNALLTGGPFQLNETYNNSFTNNTPLVQFPNPFPASLALATIPGQNVTDVPMNWTNGVIRQYNVTMERQIANLGLRLSYVGSRGSGMDYSITQVNKPQASTTAFSASRNPWPQFNQVTQWRNDGAWRYNALQAEIQKRAGQFTFNSNITWGSNYANYLNTQDPYNVTNNWSHNPDDRRIYWVTSGRWAVPVGKGQRFLANAPGIANAVVGGWAVQAIGTVATGGYVSPSFSGSDPSHTNTSGGLPDCLSNPYGAQTTSAWWNLSSFGVPPSGRYGNCAANSLETYGVRVVHMSAAKTFKITERVKSTFTAQMSNLFNHPNYMSVNTNISAANFGMFTAVAPQYMPEKTGYRQIDMKLRFEW
jgi:hypothetical protein